MIHYSCDRCNKKIRPSEEIRYVVRIEVQLALDDRENSQLEDVSLEELEEMLDAIEPGQFDEESESTNEKTFDLCSRCYNEYIDNPLAIEPAGHFGFSKN